MRVTDHFGVVSPAASERDFDDAQPNMDAIGIPIIVATLLPFVTNTSTDDAAAGLVAPVATPTVVALAYSHVAEVPVLGVAPTLAVHANPAMTLMPVTEMVLLAYADASAIDVAVGSAMAVSTLMLNLGSQSILDESKQNLISCTLSG